MTLAYAIMSGPDPSDPQTTLQPPVSLKDYGLTQTLEGLTIGIMPRWNDRTLEPAMLRQLDVFAKHFESLGATLVEIDIPDLELAKTGKQHTLDGHRLNIYPR
jgi:Asp-tRNA(Asn)/Glu-tRNA(Gln) amidotransferase A subunit family amidase